jgi:hypothetical protein
MGREKLPYPQARLAACEESLKEATTRMAAAAKAQASAEEKLSAARAKHDEAVAQYVRDPSDANATRVHRENAEVHLPELTCAHARREAETAADGLRTAERAVADAKAELAEIERVKQIEALRDMCSKETFARATAPLYAGIFERHEADKKDAKAIDDFYAASCSAAAQLRAMGEVVEDLGAHLMLEPIVNYSLKNNPARAAAIRDAVVGGSSGGFWSAFNPFGAERPIGTTFAPHFRNFILDGNWHGRDEYTGSAQEQAIADLRVLFAARTDPINALRAARTKRVEPEPAPPATAPAAMGPLGKTVLKIFSGITGEMTEIRK